MRRTATQIILWSLRLCSVAIVLWWPAILRDPIYTPRQARLTGQALHLPSSAPVAAEDEHALAIFWGWENRALVSSRWFLGPYRGLRNPVGRMQTFFVLGLFWGIGSLLLFFLTSRDEAVLAQRKSGPLAFLFTPVWKWFSR